MRGVARNIRCEIWADISRYVYGKIYSEPIMYMCRDLIYPKFVVIEFPVINSASTDKNSGDSV